MGKIYIFVGILQYEYKKAEFYAEFEIRWKSCKKLSEKMY